MIRALAASAALGLVLAACRTAAPASTPQEAPAATADAPAFAPGEALVRSEATPDPAVLKKAAGRDDLQITSVENLFGRVWKVRFVRVDGGKVCTPDSPFTLEIIHAFSKADGVLSSEPNAVRKPQENSKETAR